ncbi:MAG: hypothetical protein PVF28_07285 [Thioalkalispiraceae bacterium]|jgi:hypothetical protein
MKTRYKVPSTIRRAIGLFGLIIALPNLVWLAVGWLPGIPSIIDVYGISGLRIPSGVVIAGLLLAAFGFEDF